MQLVTILYPHATSPHMSSWSRSLLITVAGIVVALAVGCSENEPNQVPLDLSDIESKAEDAFDLALTGDVAAVRTHAVELSTRWDAYRAQATSDGVPSSAMSALDTAITQLTSVASGSPSVQELAQAANAVSEPMPAFYDIYDPAVPSQVLALDYLGREVRLDAMAGDFARADMDVNEIDSLWQGLRAQVAAAGGGSEASSFDASIATERSAIESSDAQELDNAAIDQLELVDRVETVFANSGDQPD